MATFMGGSAPAMANQVAEGFILLSSQTIKGYVPGDLNLLRAELEKQLRDARATVPPEGDANASRLRNQKIARISSALQVIVNKIQTRH